MKCSMHVTIMRIYDEKATLLKGTGALLLPQTAVIPFQSLNVTWLNLLQGLPESGREMLLP